MKIETGQGKINKRLTRGRLKKFKNFNGQTITLTSVDQLENDKHIVDYDGDSSSLEYGDNRDEPYLDRLL